MRSVDAVTDERLVEINHEADIVAARQIGRELSNEAGFTPTDITLIATAISEVARNILVYAQYGEVRLRLVTDHGVEGVEVIASDSGPGIADVHQAMQDGFSTGGSLGLGLPGARRLMDEFSITSQVGKGTTITMVKWAR